MGEQGARELIAVASRMDEPVRVFGAGESELEVALEHGQRELSQDLLDTPLLLRVFLPAAPSVAYPLWACWLRPETVFPQSFAPIVQWRKALAPTNRALPVLLLARAVGGVDAPVLWDPRLPALLDERNAVGIPDGRLLLMAGQGGAGEGPLAAQLATALTVFLSALRPGTRRTLPEGCMLLRCGRHRAVLETAPAFRVFAVQASKKQWSSAGRSTGQPLCLPAGLHLACELEGSMLWGAWRGNHRPDALTTRFVTATSRAGKALRFQFRVRESRAMEDSATQLLVAEGDVPAPAEVTKGAVHPVILRRLQAAVDGDGALQQACRTPYQLLQQESHTGPLSLEMAATPLAGPKPREPGTGWWNSHQLPSPAGFVSLYEQLWSDRDVQVMASARRETYVPNPQGTSSDGSAEQLRALATRMYRICRCLPEPAAEAARVELAWTRPHRLAMALLPGLAAALELQWQPVPAQVAGWSSGAMVRCQLAGELPAESLQAWKRLVAASKGRPGVLRSVFVALQTVLRAGLAVQTFTEVAEAVDSIWTRAQLVYRHAQIPAAVYGTSLEDPRDDAVLRRAAHSAVPGLRRIAPLWREMLQKAGVRVPKSSTNRFVQGLVDDCLAHPYPLRRLFLEELELCEALARLVSVQGDKRPRSSHLSKEAHSKQLAGLLVRVANRLPPGGSTAALLPLLLLAASGAAARADGLPGARYQMSLTPLDAEGKPNGVTVCLHGKGASSAAPRLPEAQGAGLTKAR